LTGGELVESTESILNEVRCLANITARRIDKALSDDSPDNPTGMQGFIIGYLSRNRDTDIFQRDVEAQFRIRRSTATGILQLMEKNGLIERLPVEHDARLKKLVMTQKAIHRRENVVRIIRELEAKAESGLTDTELQTFRALLRKIRTNIE
jgi:DNA-binding MarR family transcriptional regulator